MLVCSTFINHFHRKRAAGGDLIVVVIFVCMNTIFYWIFVTLQGIIMIKKKFEKKKSSRFKMD